MRSALQSARALAWKNRKYESICKLNLARRGKNVLLTVCKYLGLFRLARYWTGSGLRILCFHGVSTTDEHLWRPNLFVSPETFARRMTYLHRHGYKVMPLGDALAALRSGRLPSSAVVITFDDGYYTTYSKALPHLQRCGFPASVYLITHCFENGYPLFNYLVGYLLWKAEPGRVDLSALEIPGLGVIEYPPGGDSRDLDAVQRTIVTFGEALASETERVKLCERLAELVGQDYESVARTRALNLVGEKEVLELERAGVTIELHSHLHRFPGLPEETGLASQDMAENIRAIVAVTGHRPRHFCYPYGIWSESHWDTLASFGIESATTCDRGLVFAEDNPYSLSRILDNERMSQIEFEALVSGFAFLDQPLRRFFARVRKKLTGLSTGPGLADKP